MAVLPVSGDHQIAHLPPTAASVSAARWAAQFFNIVGHGISVRDVGAAAGRGRWAIRCTAMCSVLVFAGYAVTGFGAVRRAGSLETCGFKQAFWSLLGLRPKVTRARGRGITPAGGMEKACAGRRGRRPCQGREDIHSVKDTLCAIGTEGVFYLYLCQAVGQRWPLS